MITRLYLENFKAFSSLDMNFSNLNVFSGINGIGKSTVIQSLLLLRQSAIKSSSPTEKGINIKGDIINLGKGKDVLHSQAEEEIIKFHIEFDQSDNFEYSCIYDPDENFLLFKDQNVSWDLSKSLFGNNFQYLSAQRAEPAFFYPMDSYKVEKMNSLGKYGEFTAHFIAQNKRKEVELKELIKTEESSSYLLNQIIAWLNEISPGVTLDSTLYPELNLAKVVYSFSDESDYITDYSPVNVGFGYSYVLPVLTAILSSKKDSLLIIENPESHLHPRGQALLGILLSFAAKSGIQMFIETHSDHLINGIRIGIKKHDVPRESVRIFFFDRDEGESQTEISYPHIDNNGKLTNVPKGFLDEYSNQLDQLIL